MKSTATNKTKKVRVIPGYHLTLGITVTMLSLIVLIPLASVMVSALKLRPAEFWSLITKPTVRHAFATSIGCSFIAALINSVGDVMRWYANELGYGAEADFWQTVGILHDLDFEQWPEQHCTKEQELMREKGIDERITSPTMRACMR